MASIKLAPPWITIASEMEQLFKYDSEVHIVYDNDEHIISVYVDKQRKADALATLIPATITFGNVELHINIIPANGALSTTAGLSQAQLFENAFENNDAFVFTKQVTGIFTNNLIYVVFKNKVVQYFNDNLGDIYGNCSTLYQEIAKNIFGSIPGVYFCTDVESSMINDNKLCSHYEPLSFWP